MGDFGALVSVLCFLIAKICTCVVAVDDDVVVLTGFACSTLYTFSWLHLVMFGVFICLIEITEFSFYFMF